MYRHGDTGPQSHPCKETDPASNCDELTAAFSHSRAPGWEGTPANALTSSMTDAGQMVQWSSTQAPDPKKQWGDRRVLMNRRLDF